MPDFDTKPWSTVLAISQDVIVREHDCGTERDEDGGRAEQEAFHSA